VRATRDVNMYGGTYTVTPLWRLQPAGGTK